jgi:ABC-type Fe3+-citrate transport system substrate-binding protein
MSQRIFLIGITFLSLSIIAAAGLLASAQAQNKTQTAVITDEEAGTVTIRAGASDVVVIDETGLFVSGDIAYRGTITDGLPVHVGETGDAE